MTVLPNGGLDLCLVLVLEPARPPRPLASGQARPAGASQGMWGLAALMLTASAVICIALSGPCGGGTSTFPHSRNAAAFALTLGVGNGRESKCSGRWLLASGHSVWEFSGQSQGCLSPKLALF